MSRMIKVAAAAAAGFVAGILLAPKSGKETRDELKKKANDLKAQAEDVAHDVEQTARRGASIVRAPRKLPRKSKTSARTSKSQLTALLKAPRRPGSVLPRRQRIPRKP